MAVAVVLSVPSAAPTARDAAKPGHRVAPPKPVDDARDAVGRPPASRRGLAAAGTGGARGCAGPTPLRLTRVKAPRAQGDPSPCTAFVTARGI
ncbi:hypothetical protein [Streptomyces sp. NBC_01264]|uniref:hypothetical protein n=1 Tax=Streptomyces sp. NBC_01264 TaxID=2903804 RepID=UPI00224CA10B|nr:hypothetical protein [Streptomyces sp. NBC_01264]MCX4775739.1 hypothetical protein [Streptomyces sp. NBC_01264]